MFDTEDVFPLEADEIKTLVALGRLDWSAIEPTIFGTLFERGLDPAKRSQLGAHYTDRGSIMRLVDPVVVEPLRDEWATVKAEIGKHREKAVTARDKATKAIEAATATRDKAKAAKALTTAKTAETKAMNQAEKLYRGFLDRLASYRVLDPACGSANFLYLALRALKDLEHEAILEAAAMGFERPFPRVGPENVHGIELSPYAAELARVTVWIGEIQWMLQHGWNLNRSPILSPLDNIENRDAVLNPDGTEPDWPDADAIIGNPPFLGDKRMLSVLGEDYATRLRTLYKGRVPGGADLVTYWFEKARAQIEAGRVNLAGLVATQSIRKGGSRRVLERVTASGEIFRAWSDEPWINEGADVRVSLIAFGGSPATGHPMLNDTLVAAIHPDLTSGSTDLIQAKAIPSNRGVCFMGTSKVGAFDISGDLAREWIAIPNPNGNPNSEVLRLWANGRTITKRPRDKWIIDFGTDTTKGAAALFEKPFAFLQEHVLPFRETQRREAYRKRWWIHAEARPGLRVALAKCARYVVTTRVAKHRFFSWLTKAHLPDSRLFVFCRQDDETFGILSSRFHVAWALANASRHGVGNDPTYNSETCFGTFPFPAGLTLNLGPASYTNPHAEAIAEAGRRLNELRENWLNPPELVKRIPEVVESYPDRLLPVDSKAEMELKKRTLTNLYNTRPTWLDDAHKALDEAVAAAYGWDDYTPDMSEDEILSRLLALNKERVLPGPDDRG